MGVLGGALWGVSVLLAIDATSAGTLVASAADAAVPDCPVSLSGSNFLFGGVMTSTCRGISGACQRSAKWANECRNDPSQARFPVCSSDQAALSLGIAKQLHGGAALQATPCEMWQFIRGRTLWLIGDSHTKQTFRSLQCLLIDFWPQQQVCKASDDANLEAQLNNLPTRPGEVRCFNILGDGRICQIHNVLATSLLDNNEVAFGGVLPMLRQKFASPNDIFVIQTGAWHNKLGPPGLAQMRVALQKLGEDYARNKGQWPYMLFRESPMTHDKDTTKKICLPAPTGWTFDGANGKLVIQPGQSERTNVLARGGHINAIANEVLPQYGLTPLPGFAYSVPLHAAHIGVRGVPELDCLHYCSAGLPEILVYELLRQFKAGASGIRPLPNSTPDKVRPCTPL